MVDVYNLRFQNRTCSGSATQDLEYWTNTSVHVDYPPWSLLSKKMVIDQISTETSLVLAYVMYLHCTFEC